MSDPIEPHGQPEPWGEAHRISERDLTASERLQVVFHRDRLAARKRSLNRWCALTIALGLTLAVATLSTFHDLLLFRAPWHERLFMDVVVACLTTSATACLVGWLIALPRTVQRQGDAVTLLERWRRLARHPSTEAVSAAFLVIQFAIPRSGPGPISTEVFAFIFLAIVVLITAGIDHVGEAATQLVDLSRQLRAIEADLRLGKVWTSSRSEADVAAFKADARHSVLPNSGMTVVPGSDDTR